MTPESITKEIESALAGVLEAYKTDLRGIRSNRPSVELLEGVRVACYGDQELPLEQLASLSLGSSNEIQISVWDRSVLPAVMGAIQSANLGFSLQSDGGTIRAFLPSLSSERREEMGKLAKKAGESARIAVRGKRDEAMKAAKSAEDAGDLTEDQLFRLKDDIQKRVDKTNADIESLFEAKVKEIGE